MSPAAMRRYIVRVTDFAVYETVVLANNKQHAIEKAQALYDMNGMEDFTTNASGLEGWSAEYIGMEHAL